MSLFDDFLESSTPNLTEVQPIPIPKNNRKKSVDKDTHVWKSHLEQKNYAAALQTCKTTIQREQVYAAQAQEEFDQKRHMSSAPYFAKSNIPFDQVVLKFTRIKQHDALSCYLLHQLERLDPHVSYIHVYASD